MDGAISFEGLKNVRELGGLTLAEGGTVKAGMLYRGGQLADATAHDCETLAQLGVGEIIDLRSNGEVREKPDKAVAGANRLHIPVVDDVLVGITRDSKSEEEIREMMRSGKGVDKAYVDGYMSRMYAMFVTDSDATEGYARFVDKVIEAGERETPLFWHCTAGKDRAGFAAVVLLEALGADYATVMRDYLITNVYLEDQVGQLMAAKGATFETDESREALRGFFVAKREYLDASYRAAEEAYGGFDAYLDQALGVDSDKRAYMRHLFAR